MVPNQAIQL